MRCDIQEDSTTNKHTDIQTETETDLTRTSTSAAPDIGPIIPPRNRYQLFRDKLISDTSSVSTVYLFTNLSFNKVQCFQLSDSNMYDDIRSQDTYHDQVLFHKTKLPQPAPSFQR